MKDNKSPLRQSRKALGQCVQCGQPIFKKYIHCERHHQLAAISGHRSKESSPLRRRLVNVKSQAKKKGIEFDLIEADFVLITHCPILGIELDWGITKNRTAPLPNSPSFDRIDPAKGYIRGNVQIVSWRANRIKSDSTSAELRAIADWIDRQQEA